MGYLQLLNPNSISVNTSSGFSSIALNQHLNNDIKKARLYKPGIFYFDFSVLSSLDLLSFVLSFSF